MDYNDHEYEGHNLPITGEDSSKISSVLRPFPLPKYDFDDSLHGHLRFDSLVENEVFLGIPNQEDNQWIEEFSRGGTGIEFCSSVAESCALPRHINVWSEATSSESVEMLLKAVGQEEMIPGESVIEDSDTFDQLGSSTRQIENSSRQNDKIDDVDIGNPSLMPTEVEGIFSRSNQSAVVEGVHNTEYALQDQDTRFTYGAPVDKNVPTEISNNDMKRASDEQGETLALLDDSLPNQVLGNLPLGREIDDTGNYSQNNAVSVGQSVEQDKIGDISFASSSCVAKAISDSIEENEVCSKDEERFSGIPVEDDNPETLSNPVSSKMETLTEEKEVEIHDTKFGETSDIPVKQKSVSADDGCNEVTFVEEPVDGSQNGTVTSSGTKVQHPSECHSSLLDKSSTPPGAEGPARFGMHCSDIVTPVIDGSTELKLGPMILLSDQQKSPAVNENTCHGSDNSLKTSHATFGSNVSHKVLGNPSEKDSENNTNPADGPGNLRSSTIAGDDRRDAGDTSLMQKVDIKDGDHDTPPLVVESIQTCTTDITSIHVVNFKNISVSQLNEPTGDYLELDTEVEDKSLTSSCTEHRELAEGHMHAPPLCDTGCMDQIVETESKAPEQLCTSVPKGSLECTPVAEMKTSDQAMPSVETSSVDVPDEVCIKVSKTNEHPTNDLILKDGGAGVAPTEKPVEAEKSIKDGTKFSTLSDTCCTVELDKSNKDAEPGTSGGDLIQSHVNTPASLGSNIKDSGKVPTTSENSGVNAPSEKDGAFAVDIMPLDGQSTGDTAKCIESFPKIQPCKLSLIGEASSSICGTTKSDATIVKETSHSSTSAAAVCPSSGGMREQKPRRGSGKSGKTSAKKGNQVKDATPLKLTDKGGKSSQFSSPLGANQLMTYESALKPRGAVSVPTCSLPDLNTSSPPAFFQQPFTDLQQVQLRAQIFVYGSLIQGAAPDEACMVSAFGLSDGDRNIWDPSWRACVERLQSQKSQGNNSETPLSSRPGPKALDQSNKQGSNPSDATASISGRASNVVLPSPVNPMIPLSSPFWSIATPSTDGLPPGSMVRSSVFDYQAGSPLNPYQTPIRNYISHSSGQSQASFPVPWLASSQSSLFDVSTKSSPFDISANYPAFPTLESVKIPVKESSLPITSGTKHSSPMLTTVSGASTMLAGTPLLDSKKVKVSSGQVAETKTRKRKKPGAEDAVQSVAASLVDTVSTPAVANLLSKKAPAVEGLNQISLMARNQADSMPNVISSHYSAPVPVATPSSFVPKSTTSQLFYPVFPPSVPTDHIRRSELSFDKRAVNLEGLNKVEESKLQADEAAAHAASAVSQCESLWSQLSQQANSGLTSDAESKLASAAVAMAAAASVAKAAAAAAKIASSAAMQAKQIAEEAVTKSGSVNITGHDAILATNSMNWTNASPLSILKGGNQNNASSLSISAAREAARKRIESASAAARHAENLDAILKAAELAAEAVSHAGKIVTMSDFNLSELAVAGPNNYWKALQVANTLGSKPDDGNRNKSMTNNVGMVPDCTNQKGPDVTMHVSNAVVSPIHRELSKNLVDDHGENSLKSQKDENASDLAKTACGVSDPDVELRSNSMALSSIKAGSCVEVLKDCGDSKKAWFIGTVLSLKDAEALVCYTELKSNDGSEQLQEWIPVGAKDGDAPKIRILHPMTALQFERTKKRRRAAVKDYSWCVGDKVDAWVQDCWCEGIITEKNKKDATTLSVHFPAHGETLLVKVCHLRPTLIWSDGQWTEWGRSQQDETSQGDTPVEKRAKLGSISIDTKGSESAKNLNFGEMAGNGESRLPLSANEKVFSIGSSRVESKPNMVRPVRSGMEKEGSRVVFGVPKPGKKRKFMEVSKHYVSDRSSKANAPSDSIKLAKLLPPQGLGSRGIRNNSKLDSKEKQIAESKPRVPKSGKPPSVPRRTVPNKVDSTSSQPSIHDAASSDHTVKGSMSNDENESSEQNLTEFGSSSNVEETSGSSMVFSSQAFPQEIRKKTALRNTKSERSNQGKLAPVSAKPTKIEGDENLVSEVSEPRRSNRRIQPTSRLLEGLQTSPIIPKVPSYDKAHRTQSKGTAKGNKSHG